MDSTWQRVTPNGSYILEQRWEKQELWIRPHREEKRAGVVGATQVEFLKLAGVMLAMRYQLIHGTSCLDDSSHQGRKGEEPLYSQLAYLGYKDTIAEMRLLLKESLLHPKELYNSHLESPKLSSPSLELV